MAGVNKVTLVGNVGKDPDIRTTQQGTRIANMSIATSESWKDKQTGERQERTQWHRVVIFNENLVNLVDKYVRKGTKLYLEGQLETRKYQHHQTGQDVYTTEVVLRPYRGEIVLLSSKDSGGEQQHHDDGGYSQSQAAPAQSSQAAGYDDGFDDDIPF